MRCGGAGRDGGVGGAAGRATTDIDGQITDATGGVLPGVAVTVRNVDTNVTRELVTDANGRYRAGALRPGRYEVSASLGGFQVQPVSVTASVGQTAAIDVSKMFSIGERKSVELLWEVFNVFNWTNYTGASMTAFSVSSSTYDASANMATVTLARASGYLVPTTIGNTLFGPRDMQLALKVRW